VLDVDHDPHAKAALQAYAVACAKSHPQLSADLIARHGAALPVWELTGERIKKVRSDFVQYIRNGLDEYCAFDAAIDDYKAAALSQPVREPLSEDWILERCSQSWVFETAKQWVRMAEAAHGITKKGGE